MNILLVILDSVRAKNCSIYGHQNETTPYLSEFIENATFFKQARSPSIRSSSSHASIFSGYHTEEHYVTEGDSNLDPNESIWYQLGNDYDFSTGMFSPNVIITESMNLSAPFDKCVGPKREIESNKSFTGISPSDIEDVGYYNYLKESIKSEHTLGSILNGVESKFLSTSSWGSQDPVGESAEIYINEFLNWVKKQNTNWAATLNLMDAHAPYIPDPEYDLWGGKPIKEVRKKCGGTGGWMNKSKPRPWGQLRALESLYDGCIRQLDAGIRQLISELKKSDEYEETLILITSDHGEGFGEQSKLTPTVRLVNHNWGIAEQLTHVPLIVKEPSQTEGSKISKPASLTKFPDVVQAAINGDNCADHFIPDDQPVVSSTLKVIPPGDDLPMKGSELQSHYGPWRAVYEENEGQVVKNSTRNDDEITEVIYNAQVSYVVNGNEKARDRVSSVFNEMEDTEISIDNKKDNVMPSDTKRQLEYLGYR